MHTWDFDGRSKVAELPLPEERYTTPPPPSPAAALCCAELFLGV